MYITERNGSKQQQATPQRTLNSERIDDGSHAPAEAATSTSTAAEQATAACRCFCFFYC